MLWQRSLEDALRLCAAYDRPLFLAVNMDGESASERIVVERYRDPRWVASTRPFVCLIASAFRHASVDRDERGQRVPCPRLGEITCGEHIDLERAIFGRYLGGERIAPRHAVILRDGQKSFDLFQLFDLAELDRALAEAGDVAGGAAAGDALTRALCRAEPRAARLVPPSLWANRARSAFETGLLERPASERDEIVAAIAAAGNAGDFDALCILMLGDGRLALPAVEAARAIGRAPQIVEELAARAAEDTNHAAPERLEALGAALAALQAAGERPRHAALYERASTLLLARGAIGSSEQRAAALEGARRAFGERFAASIAEPDALGFQARDLSVCTAHGPPMRDASDAGRATEALLVPLANEADCLSELARLDALQASAGRSAALSVARARCLLELAKLASRAGGSGTDLLLVDARSALEAAAAAADAPELVRMQIALESTRLAHQEQRFADQERWAMETLRAVGRARPPARLGWRIEALRWLIDALARQSAERAQADEVEEFRSIRRAADAMCEVLSTSAAADPSAVDFGPANVSDWQGAASYLGLLGLRQEAWACALRGLERWPESDELRALFHADLWNGRRQAAIVLAYLELERQHPDSGACAWYTGFARIALAESQRRSEDPAAADAAYAQADADFQRAESLAPTFGASARHYRALAALGRGHAALLARDRARAADWLAAAVALLPAVATLRDGLGRDAQDLLDGALEWREEGDSPVGGLELARRLCGEDGDASWARATSDTLLREALRAEGRGDAAAFEQKLRQAALTAELALQRDPAEPNARALAQCLAIQAELEPTTEMSRSRLRRAAELLALPVPTDAAGDEAWPALARDLRAALGPRRPRARFGR